MHMWHVRVQPKPAHGKCRYAYLKQSHTELVFWRNTKHNYWTSEFEMDMWILTTNHPVIQDPAGVCLLQTTCILKFPTTPWSRTLPEALFFQPNSTFWNVQPPQGPGAGRKRFFFDPQRRLLKCGATPWSRILAQALFPPNNTFWHVQQMSSLKPTCFRIEN